MYSILKSQRRKLSHNQKSAITAATFLNNTHIIFCFANGYINLAKIQDNKLQDQIVSSIQLPNSIPVFQCIKSIQNQCILITKFCKFVYLLKVVQNNKLSLHQLPGTSISTVLQQSIEDPVFLNAAGFHTQIYGFENGNFCIKHIMSQDRKIYLNFYCRQSQNQDKFKILQKQLDFQMGQYVVQMCSKQGQFAFYKQSEIDQLQWELKVFGLNSITNNNKSYQPGITEKGVMLSTTQHFDSQKIINQVVKWREHSYLIIVSNKSKMAFQTYLWHRTNQNNFIQPFHQLTFSSQFKEIIYTNSKLGIFYAVNFAHVRVNGELYENTIQVINCQNGHVIETGYCTLKEINISPDGRKILDYYKQLQNDQQTLYHIRLLFQKKSLYMFLLDNMQQTKSLQANFKQSIFSLL